MDWQDPKEVAKGNQHMLAGNWKCNYNLGTFQCVLQSETNFCHRYEDPPANRDTESPFLHVFMLAGW